MQIKPFKNKKSGYTIIETMIAVALFLVVIMSGMNTLLSANLVNNKTAKMRSIMDNLSFIVEDISRNMRTGYTYRCYDFDAWNQSYGGASELDTPDSCTNGQVIVFEEAYGITGPTNTDDQWVYKLEQQGAIVGEYNIYKSINGGVTFVQLNSSEIILKAGSGFSVLGAEPPSAPTSNTQQPLTIIRLVGEIHYKNIVTPFSLQTTVTQRLIDIDI